MLYDVDVVADFAYVYDADAVSILNSVKLKLTLIVDEIVFASDWPMVHLVPLGGH